MDKRTLSIPVIVLTIAAAIFTLIAAIFLIIMNPSQLPTSPVKTESVSQNFMVNLAKEDLAKKLSLSPTEINVKSVVKKEWGDASLGCSKPGMVYIQLVTPGYQMILEANGKTYDYRSDLERRVELCTK